MNGLVEHPTDLSGRPLRCDCGAVIALIGCVMLCDLCIEKRVGRFDDDASSERHFARQFPEWFTALADLGGEGG